MQERDPLEVIPRKVGDAVRDVRTWFVIGGHAVRCFSAYRPSIDVDFGVRTATDLDDLVSRLRSRGEVEIRERTEDTVHLQFEGINVSVFVLDRLAHHVQGRRLTAGACAVHSGPSHRRLRPPPSPGLTTCIATGSYTG
jgi:hypothetical protein